MSFANGIMNRFVMQESKFGFERVKYTSFRLSVSFMLHVRDYHEFRGANSQDLCSSRSTHS